MDLVDYLLKWLPFSDPVLVRAKDVDVDRKVVGAFDGIRYFLQRFPCLLPEDCSVERINEQFTLYQGFDVRSCTELISHDIRLGTSKMGHSRSCPLLCAHCETFSHVCRKIKPIKGPDYQIPTWRMYWF